MKNALLEKIMTAKSTSGSIHIDGSDGTEVSLEASSGSIHAEFLTNKDFSASATSGGVHLPENATGEKNGTCNAKTTSGSIHLSIK